MTTREINKTYTIGELAKLAGVSVRTLHHYDQIGLLHPGTRDPENDYRRYGREDLLRLQQILFFRELDLPLQKIEQILADPAADRLALLRQHHRNLGVRIGQLQTLQSTLEKTIQNLQEENSMPLTDAELYEGFDQATIDRYQKEVQETYDPEIVALANRNTRKLSKAEWAAVKAEGEAISAGLAKLMGHDPADSEVQAFAARQHAWVEHFYPVTAEMFRGLGELYTSHPEFRANYDKIAPGLADFLQKAMTIYADTVLENK